MILPEELSAAIAQEVHNMLLGRAGRIPRERSLPEVLSTPLDQPIESSTTDL